jgi:hypothetical protein
MVSERYLWEEDNDYAPVFDSVFDEDEESGDD